VGVAYVPVCVVVVQVIRELDRERTQLERQEKKLVVDIKKMAKSGQMDAVKIMAKDLVRTRAFIKKFILMRANIQGIALKIQTLKSQAAMANAMKGEWIHDPLPAGQESQVALLPQERVVKLWEEVKPRASEVGTLKTHV